MIGESSSITTLINSDRVARENLSRPGTRQDNGDEGLEQRYADVISFSPQALALARNIAPAAATAEEGQTQSQDQGQEDRQLIAAGYLDIRI
jgi:hypothetical protein